jgi:hypothetical protein
MLSPSTSTRTTFVAPRFRTHSTVGIRFVWIVGVGVGFEEEVRAYDVALLAMDLLGYARLRILHSHGRGVVEGNRGCIPVGNKRRTIHLVVLVGVDSSY